MLDFLAKLEIDFNTQEVNEEQSFRLYLSFSVIISLRHFYIEDRRSHHGKVTALPEAVQWLIWSYTAENTLRKSVSAPKAVIHRPK